MMAFTHYERWYFSTPLDEVKQLLTDELQLPVEIDDAGDDEVTVIIRGEDRAALESIFARLGIREAEITDDDGKRVTFDKYDFELVLLVDWDGPFEWIMEVNFSEEEMDFEEWPYLMAVAGALAERLGGKHASERTGEEVLEEGHLWAPPPVIKQS